MASQRSTSTFNRGCTGDMAMASRKAESEVEIAFAFALGIEALRRRVVLLVGDSPRVERFER